MLFLIFLFVFRKFLEPYTQASYIDNVFRSSWLFFRYRFITNIEILLFRQNMQSRVLAGITRFASQPVIHCPYSIETNLGVAARSEWRFYRAGQIMDVW